MNNSNSLWLDVEGDYGWRHVFNSCDHPTGSVTASLDRSTFNGFREYVWDNSGWYPGVYSTHSFWDDPGGSFGSMGSLDISEWTANWAGTDNHCHNPGPYEWTQTFPTACDGYSTFSAKFFGGIGTGSPCAMAWQWSGGNSDYTQIDANRQYSCQ